MRIKLDEDLSEQLTEPFRKAGYETTTVYRQHWSGKSDTDLWSLVQHEKEFFVTADLDFSDLRRYRPGSHHGILILRSKSQLISSFLQLAEAVLKNHRLEEHVGHLIVVSENGVRVRRQ